MGTKDTALLEEADWLFRKLVRRFVKERDKITIHGIALPGILILNSIARQGEQRLGDLAEQLDFTSGAVTALCDKLEAGGYAVRKRSESDRRSVVLDITPTGKELLNRTRETGPFMIETLFGEFSQAELEGQIAAYKQLIDRLDGFSDKVVSHLEETAAVAVPPREENPAKRTNPFISY